MILIRSSALKWFTLLLILLFFSLFLFPQDTPDAAVKHSPENSQCFSCHGSPTYTYFNEYTERTVTKRMNPYFLIDSVLYYDQNHKTFKCKDCHPSEFKVFPHDNTLRMEPLPTCLDCHEGDDNTAQFHFEQIAIEFHESVHSNKHSQDFTCWMCHNPHTYKINARTNENIRETIIYDNNICLSCHADIDKYNLISKQVNPNVIEKHDWLPNQVAHFGHVRCIECHTQISDTVMVAHLIQPKESAVKKCIECHSQDSRLIETLYKFRAKETRNKYGFLNAATLSNSYIIGANRNYYLNVASVIIFGGVLLLMTIHAFLRIVIK